MHALVIEQDSAVQAAVQAALVGRGHEVVVCAEAQAALAKIAPHSLQLIVAGQSADLADDIKCCRQIRELIAAMGSGCCYLLYVARNHDPACLQAALAAGADDYLLWPLEPAALDLRLSVAERSVRTLAERQAAEGALREVVERFDLAARGSDDGLWDGKIFPGTPWHSPNTQVWYSARMRELVGYSEAEFPNVLSSWAQLLHPEDAERIFDALRRHLEEHEPYDVEYRLLTRAGEYRWFSARGKGIWDEQGKPLRMAGSLRDITDKKRQEEALRNEQRVLRRLLDVTERDRRLMAYEIHDGLVQYVTGALMHLEVFALHEPISDPRGRQEFEFALRLLRSSVDEARRLISGLRPPILDESGIVPAIEYLLHEQRAAGEPVIEFAHDVQFERLPSTLESAVFRIAQEALTNIRRHSRAQRARLELNQRGDRLALLVQDWGVGFDPRQTPDDRFGLQGIRERVRLLDGTSEIESKLGQGTRVFVELPLIGGGTAGGQDAGDEWSPASSEPCVT